jgi:hypothetical protein
MARNSGTYVGTMNTGTFGGTVNTGTIGGGNNDLFTSTHRGVSQQFTQETANEVGVTLSDYNPNLTSRDAGKIGGRITQKLVGAGKNALGQ